MVARAPRRRRRRRLGGSQKNSVHIRITILFVVHVIKMIGYIESIHMLGFAILGELATNVILRLSLQAMSRSFLMLGYYGDGLG